MGIDKLSTIWPEWKKVNKLGEGAFGEVYEIVRESHGIETRAALKVISIPKSSSEIKAMRSEGLDENGTRAYFSDIVNDFVNEIKLMATMKGTANIVSVEDYEVIQKVDEIGWDIFIRMELLVTLDDYITNKNLTETEVIKLGIDVCSALELCSQRNIIHRDIKPENIFVSSFGDFKIGDFGISRELEKTGGALSQKGTPNYMAPEVKTSNNYDATVDIYSLGLVLYKLLNNNRLPFVDPNSQDIRFQDRERAIERRFNGESLPAPINASPELSQIILLACSFDPKKRFKTATAFKNALGRTLSHFEQQDELDQTMLLTKAKNGSGQPIDPDATVLLSSVIDDLEPIQPTDPDATVQVRQAPVSEKIGAEVQDVPMQTFGKEPKKKSKAKRILVSILLLFILIGAGAGVYFMNPGGVLDGIIGNPMADLITALEEGDYDLAVTLSEELDNERLYDGLNERLETIAENFLNEETEFAVVTMELNAIERMDVFGLSLTLAETRSFVNNLNNSRTAFNTAEAMYARGDYANAISQYLQVLSTDPNYSYALDGVIRANTALRNEALTTAANYSSGGNYGQAIRVLNDTLRIIENDSELTQQLNLYTTAFANASRQAALVTASAYASNGNLVSAITVLRNALRDMPNDSLIEQRLNEYEQLFVVEMVNQAEGLAADGQHDTAISLLGTALQTMPGNTELTNMRNDVTAARPVSLASVVVVDSRHFVHFEDIFTDSFGNHYHESFRFYPRTGSSNAYSNADRASYAVFNLNNNFNLFSADIVAPEGLASDAEFLAEISFNNNATFEIVADGFNVRTGMVSFEVDVSGATTMTITVRVRDSGWGNNARSIRLVNAVLSN